MMLCFKAGLAQFRKKVDVAPDSIIKVGLPIKVQKAVDSWKKWGVVRDDGTQVLIAVFSG